MKPVFFSFKSINITWFMALALLAIFISYFVLKLILNRYKEDKEYIEKLENIFSLVVISGFIGARIMYVLLNLSIFKASPSAMIKISHYNLSLIGGVVSGILALMISSRKYKIEFYKLLDVFSKLFYISMAIGVWNFLFDVFLLNSYNMGNSQIRVFIMSLLFLLAIGLQIYLEKNHGFKHTSIIVLFMSLMIYYVIKLGLIF